MPNIIFEEFTWFTPKPKAPPLAITIPNQNVMYFNAKSVPLMPDYITIGVHESGKTLCIRKQENGYRLPKNGAVKAIDLISYLWEKGVRPPARYTLQAEEDYWIASLEASSLPKVRAKKEPRRISKATAKNIMKELDCL